MISSTDYKPFTAEQVSLLGVWSDLEAAYHGRNGYGGTVAEIYAYRLVPEHACGQNCSLLESACAAQRLTDLLRVFAKLHDPVTIGIEVEAKVFRAFDPHGEQLPPFGHRIHLEIVSRRRPAHSSLVTCIVDLTRRVTALERQIALPSESPPEPATGASSRSPIAVEHPERMAELRAAWEAMSTFCMIAGPASATVAAVMQGVREVLGKELPSIVEAPGIPTLRRAFATTIGQCSAIEQRELLETMPWTVRRLVWAAASVVDERLGG